MKVFIGMETSGVMRRAFQDAGHHAISCDYLACQDQAEPFQLINEVIDHGGGHLCGDVFTMLKKLRWQGWVPDLAIFHPDCTYFTVSAAWAFKDPDFERYPGIGYHMKLKAGTLVGKDRRERQAADLEIIHKIQKLTIKTKIVENPIGQLSTLWMRPSDIVQPYEFGDDASKATCLWILDENGERVMTKLDRDPALYVPPTLRPNGKSYWANQTDTGQNRLPPAADRWQDRADTYPGIASAIVKKWGGQ